MSNLSFIHHLEKKLQQPLPGHKAHQKMYVIGHAARANPPEDALQAGVMALFFPLGESWQLIFIKRSNRYHDDRHKGQIGFPGGKYESEDRDLMDTALRETREEIGVEAEKIKVLGSLSELYIPVSQFNVHPFVGFLEKKPEFSLQAEEVDRVIYCGIHRFFNKDCRSRKDMDVDEGIRIHGVPYYDLEGEVLWGATAMITSELLETIGRLPDGSH